jgi:hypothetical protein
MSCLICSTYTVRILARTGKSHFLKTLSYLLANIEARDDQGNTRKAVSFFDASKLRDVTIRADIDKAELESVVKQDKRIRIH